MSQVVVVTLPTIFGALFLICCLYYCCCRRKRGTVIAYGPAPAVTVVTQSTTHAAAPQVQPVMMPYPVNMTPAPAAYPYNPQANMQYPPNSGAYGPPTTAYPPAYTEHSSGPDRPVGFDTERKQPQY